jgi:hypothetical protein
VTETEIASQGLLGNARSISATTRISADEANRFNVLDEPTSLQAQALIGAGGRLHCPLQFDITPATDERPYFRLLQMAHLPELWRSEAGGLLGSAA